MREHNFKTEEDAKRYAIIALNQIADLCEDLGISFWPGEENHCDDMFVCLDGSDLDFCHEPDKYLYHYTLAEWLRYHTKQLQEELEKK